MIKEDKLSTPKTLPAGRYRLGVQFTPREKSETPTFTAGDVALLVNGEKVAELQGIKMAGQYSNMTGYGLLIGRNTGTPVSHEYKAPFTFTGKLEKVVIDVK